MKENQTRQMLTIGQLATYAGVTIKAIRHYHKCRLLGEPPRDSSNYRRYSAQDAIALVKIKTLAAAGVPLARIKVLLTASPDAFAAAIAEIDLRLQQRITDLNHAREHITQLSSGDALFVSADVANYLDRLRKLGVSERVVEMEREVWILMQSVSPETAAVWSANKRAALDDPEFCALYLAYDAAFDWSANDPRLDALARRSARWSAQHQGEPAGDGNPGSTPDPGLTRLIALSFAGVSPAWDRLAKLSRAIKTDD